MESAIETIIFDVGGVLIQDAGRKSFLKNYSVCPKIENDFWSLYKVGKISELEYWKQTLKQTPFSGKEEEVAMEVRKHFATLKAADIISLIPKLYENKYNLAILSNHVTEWVWPFLVHNNLNHFFDPILISSEIKLAKPQPEIFDYLLDTIGYSNKPKSCLFIDDKKENIQVAQWLGMQGLQFKGKDNLEEELKKINII